MANLLAENDMIFPIARCLAQLPLFSPLNALDSRRITKGIIQIFRPWWGKMVQYEQVKPIAILHQKLFNLALATQP